MFYTGVAHAKIVFVEGCVEYARMVFKSNQGHRWRVHGTVLVRRSETAGEWLAYTASYKKGDLLGKVDGPHAFTLDEVAKVWGKIEEGIFCTVYDHFVN